MARDRRRGRKGRPLPAPDEPVEITLDGFAHGAEAVGRRPDGKVCFVGHALPGEVVRVQVESEHRSWSRARLLEVLEPAAQRVEPPCPYAHPGRCGGCALQHTTPEHQATLLHGVVVDLLERIGRIADPPVTPTRRPHGGDGLGYRNRARFAVAPDGRLGFHRQGTHDVLPIDRCPLLTSAAQRTREEAGDDWPGVQSVTVRAGDDGAGLIEVVPGEGLLPVVPPGNSALALVDSTGTAHPLRGDPVVHHHVGDASFEVSATSFFQPSIAAAGVLVEEVLTGAEVRPGARVLDLYSGVGLLSRALATAGAAVTAVEAARTAVADAQRNCAGLAVDVVEADAERFLDTWAEPVDCVVLDPPRRGAGLDLCRSLGSLAASRIVYVSCDPASLARDAKVLTEAGYRLIRAVPVDQFTHTGHIEVVATFHRR